MQFSTVQRAAFPAQLTGDNLSRKPVVGGCSSFGYAGTIAHVVLRRSTGDTEPHVALLPLEYRRRAFRWLVPPHPFVQRRLSSSDGTDVFRSPAAGALHAIVADHVVQGRVIFPGAGYLEAARAATSGSALGGVYFLQPLAVEANGLLVECAVMGDRFEVRSIEDGSSMDAAVHCSGLLTAHQDYPHVDHAKFRANSCMRAAHIGALYDGFNAVGIHYGPGYRNLAQAWCGASDALARLRVRRTHEGTHVHPADLDDALCTSALTSSNKDSGKTQLPFSVEYASLHGTPGDLWAVRHPPHITLCACQADGSVMRLRAGCGATEC